MYIFFFKKINPSGAQIHELILCLCHIKSLIVPNTTYVQGAYSCPNKE